MLIRLLTRQSRLALCQAGLVKDLLESKFNDIKIQLISILSEGDKILDGPLYTKGGKGLFIKELERHLLNGTADIAVHSMKDMEVKLPPELIIAAILEREDPRDAFLANNIRDIKEIPPQALIGTSSLRRSVQLSQLNSNAQVKILRGNVDTRVNKLQNNEFDAIILAVAGLKRLGLAHKITQYLDADMMLPAIGQGAIGIECRQDRVDLIEILHAINHPASNLCVSMERQMNEHLGGSCNLPVAGFCSINNNIIKLQAMVSNLDGSKILYKDHSVSLENSDQLVPYVTESLFSDGAGQIIESIKCLL